MPCFRDSRQTAPDLALPAPLRSLDPLRSMVAEVLRPAHFFVGRAITLEWEYQPRREESWEIFQGRLLDPAQTRQRQVFETWSVFSRDAAGRSEEPVLSLKLDRPSQQLHVTRAILSYAWEGYDAGDNVFLSRETRKWVRELVGTIRLPRFTDANRLRDELIALLFQAVVGTSRLPLTSVEAPLPAFTLGELAYVYRANLPDAEEACRPLRSVRDLIEQALRAELAWLEKAKLLETVLRTTPAEGVEEAAEHWAAQWQRLGHSQAELVALWRTLFNEVALSPYTEFVDRSLAVLQALVDRHHLTPADQTDFLSYLLRQIGRHLTAYDLITFHHRGANYPDALLLDALLHAYRRVIASHPDLFLPTPADPPLQQDRKRLRRRALRQGWLLRCRYQGLPVPEAPSSTGENLRVLPPPHGRVPEEQILVPARRTKRLFAGNELGRPEDPVLAEVMQQSLADLRHPAELQELGVALFLDRPLGTFKTPTEPDQTLLFSYEAFSATVAEQRLKYLAEALGLIAKAAEYESLRSRFQLLPQEKGLALPVAPKKARPGVVSLQDAGRVAPDFLFLKSTRKTVQDFLAQFDFAPLASRYALNYLAPGRRVLILNAAAGTAGTGGILTIYDAALRPRMELQVDPSLGYARRAGQEYPAAGLRLLRLWEPGPAGLELVEQDLRGEGWTVRPAQDGQPV